MPISSHWCKGDPSLSEVHKERWDECKGARRRRMLPFCREANAGLISGAWVHFLPFLVTADAGFCGGEPSALVSQAAGRLPLSPHLLHISVSSASPWAILPSPWPFIFHHCSWFWTERKTEALLSGSHQGECLCFWWERASCLFSYVFNKHLPCIYQAPGSTLSIGDQWANF